VRRQVKEASVYDPSKDESLQTFIKINYLNDVDIFNPWNFQMHLLLGKQIAFLAFNKYIDLNKDEEYINFLILKIS